MNSPRPLLRLMLVLCFSLTNSQRIRIATIFFSKDANKTDGKMLNNNTEEGQ